MTEKTPYDFSGKVALVTGGSRGVGRACVLKFAAGGANICINYYNNEEAAKKVAAEAEALGARTFIQKADVTSEEQVTKLVDAVAQEWGRLDFIVSNAVGFPPEIQQKMAANTSRRMADLPIELVEYMFDVQAKALLLCAREGSKLMAKNDNGGSIVAISSVGSFRTMRGYLAPGVAKAALESMIRYLALDLGQYKIRVNGVSGAAIDTDALNHVTRQKDKMLEMTAQRTPLGRYGTPEDFARVVAFLCSEEAEFVDGQTIITDGGFTLT